MTQKLAMAAKFTPVSLEDMDKFLKRSFRVFRPTQDVERGEIVYRLKIGKFVGVLVWTSVGSGREVGAHAGQDAIRVGLISMKDRRPLTGDKFAIVKRVEKWRDNLKDRIEDCLEKYDEKPEAWETWAETRKWPKAEPEPVREPEKVRDEDSEGDAPRGPQLVVPPVTPYKGPTPPTPVRQYDPSKMRGVISEKQMNFIGILMRGMNQTKWENIEGPRITGLKGYPKGRQELSGLPMGKASELIDALKKGSRYASFEDFEGFDFDPYDYDARTDNPTV